MLEWADIKLQNIKPYLHYHGYEFSFSLNSLFWKSSLSVFRKKNMLWKIELILSEAKKSLFQFIDPIDSFFEFYSSRFFVF